MINFKILDQPYIDYCNLLNRRPLKYLFFGLIVRLDQRDYGEFIASLEAPFSAVKSPLTFSQRLPARRHSHSSFPPQSTVCSPVGSYTINPSGTTTSLSTTSDSFYATADLLSQQRHGREAASSPQETSSDDKSDTCDQLAISHTRFRRVNRLARGRFIGEVREKRPGLLATKYFHEVLFFYASIT